MLQLLIEIYGPDKGRQAFDQIVSVVEKYDAAVNQNRKSLFSHEDVVLITYGDSLNCKGEKPLYTFKRFSEDYFKDIFSHIHFLPFFPYSSDDGFSVKDFHSVRQDLGDWGDIAAIGGLFELMFDFVLNHISSESGWFGKYLNDEEGFRNLAIEVAPETDLSSVVRPRALPLLTPFQKKDGHTVWVWTTFSSDQIDLNYGSIDMLSRMVDVLLYYVSKGALVIRMDAVAYLWKQAGTSCIHHKNTHLVVKLLRCLLDVAAPRTMIITETNVPHQENIRYFGNGADEAQLVYNFTLPPLLLHTLISGDASDLLHWAQGLKAPSDQTTFFNFTASHDGIGVRPLEGILPPSAVARLASHVLANNGSVSTKNNADGTESPYELNISYVDAMRRSDENTDIFHIERFLASQAIALVLPGVPAIYIHSILGSRNWCKGVALTGRARSINREPLDARRITDALEDDLSFRARVFYPYTRLIRLRRHLEALHPAAESEILFLNPKVFAIRRRYGTAEVTALTNVSDTVVSVVLPDCHQPLKDIISGVGCSDRNITLTPYQSAWMIP